jgi:uncharacterized protein YjbJ (UPF0337 family)
MHHQRARQAALLFFDRIRHFLTSRRKMQDVLCLSAASLIDKREPPHAHQNSSSYDPDIAELQPHPAGVIRRVRTTRSAASFVHLQRRQSMNWDQIQVNWMQFKDKIANNWAKLTDEDLTRIGGRRNELVGRLQVRYGFAKVEAEREIEAWTKAQRHAA